MTQVQNFAANSTEMISAQNAEGAKNVNFDEIVGNLVTQGLPQAFNPDNFLSKIADTYAITLKEARTCLKRAIGELENKNKETEKTTVRPGVQEVYARSQAPAQQPLNAQSGYYYPSMSMNLSGAKNDGMDNLNSYGAYNRIMFGLK